MAGILAERRNKMGHVRRMCRMVTDRQLVGEESISWSRMANRMVPRAEFCCPPPSLQVPQNGWSDNAAWRRMSSSRTRVGRRYANGRWQAREQVSPVKTKRYQQAGGMRWHNQYGNARGIRQNQQARVARTRVCRLFTGAGARTGGSEQ